MNGLHLYLVRFNSHLDLLRDSRKIFRLGKSFNELIFIIEKLTNELSFKVTPTNLLEVLSKFGYFFYWIFDNLGILSKLKLLSLDPNNMNKYAALAWFTGTVLVLFKQLIELNTLLSDKKKQDPSKTDNVLDKKIFNLYVNIIGKIGDVFPSAQGSNISVMLYGKPFSEVTVGFGGMIAALVALYNL